MPAFVFFRRRINPRMLREVAMRNLAGFKRLL
jgi:hypothetical protein